VSSEEARLIRRKARAQKTTLSEYLRQSALREKSRRRPKPVIKKHTVSGLPYDASGVDEPKVTRDEIANALADFP
jgi:hypothetical protein